jgi:hypothetical protein
VGGRLSERKTIGDKEWPLICMQKACVCCPTSDIMKRLFGTLVPARKLESLPA